MTTNEPVDELTSMFERAAAIAARMPANLQEAAFERALDALQGAPAAVESAQVSTHASIDQTKTHDPVTALKGLSRDRAPEIDAQSGSLGHTLALLLIARREFGIDGLSAPQIAEVLTDKFRHRYTRQAIGQAMDRAGRLVDRKPDGRAVTFRLMQAGEEWLKSNHAGDALPTASSPPNRRKQKRRGRADSDLPEDGAPTHPTVSSKSPAKTSSKRIGPKAALEGLIADGFFASPQTISSIGDRLTRNFARTYGPSDLSPTLIRLLREKRLVRTKSEGGSYEYIAP
jgi:hypothetical protein